ncbi:hypothetical protein GSI_09053 [Ganoderma sinense ZZ0214-1]|uniref:F-box domain-containing protein n=1 Tax=Ganoderma sinense ZZ0214-1 TaxID=1077348 RepID=A0A2G8S5E7_9APHY|nr:hypothetical protein GSI_09053 [Ganoderma sinense ZZ0214-1]
MPPFLPCELTDIIIFHVDDANSLCSCSLVCHDWVAASRHCLFSDAHMLSPSQYDALVNRVLRSESMYPWLSSMRTLELDCEDGRWFKKRNGGPRYRFFHEFAGHLPNLHLLSLVGLDWVRSPLHASTPSALSQFPSLVELRLENCTFQSFDMFRRILVAIPNLSTLMLYAVQWPSQPNGLLPGSRMLPQRRPCLVAFSIQFYAKNDCAGTLFDWLVNCTPSRSTIRQLRFTLGGSPSASIKPEHAQFLESVSASVESLRIQARDDFPISCFSKLSPLTIKGSWEGILRTLNGLNGPLRVLQIESAPTRVLSAVDLGHPASLENEDGGADMTGGLNELDTLLEDDRFKSMERLEFMISPVPSEFNFMLCLVDGHFRESIEERLPKLCKEAFELSTWIAHIELGVKEEVDGTMAAPRGPLVAAKKAD